MPPVVKLLGALFLVGGALVFLADRVLLWMEARGWIYWRRTQPGRRGGVGNAFLEVQALLEPDKKYVLEARRKEEAAAEDEQDAGDGTSPDAPAKSSRRP